MINNYRNIRLPHISTYNNLIGIPIVKISRRFLHLLFPNPTKHHIFIDDGKYGEQFNVLDLEGRKKQSFIAEIYPYKLDTTQLAKGIYFLQRSSSRSIYKFIKE